MPCEPTIGHKRNRSKREIYTGIFCHHHQITCQSQRSANTSCLTMNASDIELVAVMNGFQQRLVLIQQQIRYLLVVKILQILPCRKSLTGCTNNANPNGWVCFHFSQGRGQSLAHRRIQSVVVFWPVECNRRNLPIARQKNWRITHLIAPSLLNRFLCFRAGLRQNHDYYFRYTQTAPLSTNIHLRNLPSGAALSCTSGQIEHQRSKQVNTVQKVCLCSTFMISC